MSTTAPLDDAEITTKFINKTMVQKAKKKVMKELKKQFKRNLKKTGMYSIFFNVCIKVANMVMEVENFAKLNSARSKEEPYSFTASEDGSEYLF